MESSPKWSRDDWLIAGAAGCAVAAAAGALGYVFWAAGKTHHAEAASAPPPRPLDKESWRDPTSADLSQALVALASPAARGREQWNAAAVLGRLANYSECLPPTGPADLDQSGLQR
jgi:hypothetical protein